MKKRSPLTPKQTITACLLLFLFAGTTLLFFGMRNDEERFEAITDRLFIEEMTSSTLNMHYTLAHPAAFGIEAYDAVLPCYDRASELKGQADAENLLSTLRGFDAKELSDTDAYTYRLLTRSLENGLGLNAFPYYTDPLSPHSGMQTQLPVLLAEYTFRCKRDVQDYLNLLDQTDEYFASLLTYEQEKADAGLLMPASTLEKVKEQCDTILTAASLKSGNHFLQTTFRERLQPLIASGEITDEEAASYISLNDRLLRTVMLPAYISLADGLFILEDASVPLEGLSAKPDGSAYYEYLLRSETGSYRSIAEIKQLLSEAFHQEYTAIHDIAAQHPDLSMYLQNESTDAFPLADADAMLIDLQHRMTDDFPSFPETSSLPEMGSLSEAHSLPEVTVKPVSESLEKYSAPAFYLTTPLDDTDNNVIYINQRQAPSGLELYTTLAHEGYPGHLYQTVYCNRLFNERQENLIRQALWYGGYQEGWALYVEFMSFDYATELLQEQGMEQDALCAELEKHNRSLQLCLYSLLDIMIHYDNASYAQVARVLESFGISEDSSIEAIYTYIVEEPCNYLKYYLGYLEIQELQKEAQTLWQNDYSDLRFHTFLLNCGPSDFATMGEELYRQQSARQKTALQSSSISIIASR